MGTIANFYLKFVSSKKFIYDLLAFLFLIPVICNHLCARDYFDFHMVEKLLLELCLRYLHSLLILCSLSAPLSFVLTLSQQGQLNCAGCLCERESASFCFEAAVGL